MVHIGRFITSRRPEKPVLLLLVFVLTLMVQPAAIAVIVDDLFEVEIYVPDESAASRRVALSDGLAEVLVRVSGDRNILQRLRPPSPSAYVKQFRYISTTSHKNSSSADPNNRTGNQNKLWVQYNGTLMMDLLRENAVPIWGEHRSQAVIWFAVQDGTKRYMLKSSDFSLLKKEADAAFKRRGIPAVWPKHDSRDRQGLSFADVWAGFAQPLLKSSKRYSNGPAVSVSMSWNGHAWTGDWSLYMAHDTRRWNLRERDYDALISKGIDLVADAMGKKYAVMEVLDDTKLQQVLVEIDRVNSVESFRQVQSYLKSLPVVHSVRLSQVESDRVAFWLSLRSEVDDFLGIVKAGNEIRPEKNTDINLAPDAQNFVHRFKRVN